MQICEVYEADASDVDKAVAAAKAAFPAWARLPSDTRADYMRKITAAIQKYATEFAHIEALDNGLYSDK